MARKKARAELQCLECGKKFKRAVVTFDIKCPKCGGYDIDVDAYPAPTGKKDTLTFIL
jgi:DNA polymerase II large subunit